MVIRLQIQHEIRWTPYFQGNLDNNTIAVTVKLNLDLSPADILKF
jgi:hypothetical protein